MTGNKSIMTGNKWNSPLSITENMTLINFQAKRDSLHE